MILYLYRKEVVWIAVWDLDCVVGGNVDFYEVLRYWVRYLNFDEWIDKMLDFTGFG